ncbi:histidine kinase dimerization/phosphoacceptor domain -containing protein [Chitinophaga sp. S165]|uniref:histidine kinase dimerization/phosphoacceptor domain -containing protein n=1 Tax=Chitinophaga sp. S165 TaxID=2135462 RepID=UPI001304F645|nr:histidine kinase dimerization/phosphoacceptor domain -containing protein [Chitinophaga sp. S165]
MNKLLLLFYCMTSCVVHCLAQDKKATSLVLQQLLKKNALDTADMRVLIGVGNDYVNRPGIESGDMDTAGLCADKVLKSAIKDKLPLWEGLSYLLYSKIHREQNILEKGKGYGLKAAGIFSKYKQKEYLADAYSELSDYYPPVDVPTLKIKLKYYTDAAKLYGEVGAKMKQANTLYILGDYYSFLPDYNEAVNLLLQSVVLFKEVGHKELQGVYNLLGAIYNQLGDTDNALKYGLLAVRTAEEVKDSTTQLITIYNRLGMIYNGMDVIDKAMDSYQKALSLAIRMKDTASMQILSRNICRAYQKMNRPAEALKIIKKEERDYPPQKQELRVLMLESIVITYCMLKEFGLALPYVQQLEEYRRKMAPDDSYLEYVNTALITYYLAVHQNKTVYEYASDMLDAAKKTNLLAMQGKAYSFLYRADSAMGNYKEALEHFRLFKVVNDSLFNIAKFQKISRLQLQFETEQKDQALKLKEQNIQLLTREAQLQKADLHRARFTKNVIIASACMLVALLLLGFNRYKLKMESNRRLEQQQEVINYKNRSLEQLLHAQNKLLDEKEWLLKEIHHRVKNNLQIVMSLLNTQAAFLDDKDALNAIKESRYRMQAISLIHQKLYQSENTALIDMPVYICDLVEYLKDGVSATNMIKFDLDIAPLKLDVSQSVPIGLILNEAITNAIKYAFTGKGTITISLHPVGSGRLGLIIADNGKGFPAGKIPTQHGSMGMMLMNTLAEQLDGTVDIQSQNGVIITVLFKHHLDNTLTEAISLDGNRKDRF